MLKRLFSSASFGQGFPPFLSFILCFLLLTFRSYARLENANFWAEDGNVFLNEVLSSGLKSVFFPYAGYFHLIQRSAVWLLWAVVPLKYLAYSVTLFCLAVIAFVASQIVHSDFDWILPSKTTRFILALLFCLSPGLTEMAGSLCNLNWFLTLWISFLLLKSRTPSIPERVGILFVLLSIGTGVLVLPLAFWRFRKNRKAIWMVAVFAVGYLAALAIARDPAFSGISHVDLIDWFKTYQKQFRTSALLQPLLGDRITIALSKHSARYVRGALSYLALSALVFWFFKTKRKPASQALLIQLMSFSAWVFMVWVGRKGSIGTFHEPPSTWLFSHRYSFPMAWPAFFLWFTVLDWYLSKPKTNRYKKPVYAVIAVWIISQAGYRFFIPAYGPQAYWTQSAPQLESSLSTGCPNTVTIHCYPEPAFHFNYTSPMGVSCPKGSD